MKIRIEGIPVWQCVSTYVDFIRALTCWQISMTFFFTAGWGEASLSNSGARKTLSWAASWASELARAILRSTLLTRASSASAIAIELIVVNGGVSRSGIEMEKKKKMEKGREYWKRRLQKLEYPVKDERFGISDQRETCNMVYMTWDLFYLLNSFFLKLRLGSCFSGLWYVANDVSRVWNTVSQKQVKATRSFALWREMSESTPWVARCGKKKKKNLK